MLTRHHAQNNAATERSVHPRLFAAVPNHEIFEMRGEWVGVKGGVVKRAGTAVKKNRSSRRFFYGFI